MITELGFNPLYGCSIGTISLCRKSTNLIASKFSLVTFAATRPLWAIAAITLSRGPWDDAYSPDALRPITLYP